MTKTWNSEENDSCRKSTVSVLLFFNFFLNMQVFISVFNVKSEVTSNTKEQREFLNQKEGPHLMHLPPLDKANSFEKKPGRFVDVKRVGWLITRANLREGPCWTQKKCSKLAMLNVRLRIRKVLVFRP